MQDNVFFKCVIKAVKQGGMLFDDRAMVARASRKSQTDFVTDVDIAVQRQISRALKVIAPDIQLMGEEKDNTGIDLSKRVWILDPVDGTMNLLHNCRASAVSLALVDAHEVVMGIVYNPFSGELFTARRGEGARLNGEPISVSETELLSESLCSTGTNPSRREQADEAFRYMRILYDRCHDIRRIGAASIEMCYTACGRFDGFVERALNPWDYAAAMLILHESGGTVTDADGNPPPLGSGGTIVASNGRIHRELLALLGK